MPACQGCAGFHSELCSPGPPSQQRGPCFGSLFESHDSSEMESEGHTESVGGPQKGRGQLPAEGAKGAACRREMGSHWLLTPGLNTGRIDSQENKSIYLSGV